MIETSIIRPLLESIGEIGSYTLTEVTGGFNNRASRIDTGQKRYLLKEYFRDDKDPRDRLGAEFDFCCFAFSNGVGGVAKPYASHTTAGLGLYEFIEGVDCRSGDISLERVLEAANFFKRLNMYKGSPAARKLGRASEACFSLEDHLHCVSRRVDRVSAIAGDDSVSQQAAQFAKEHLEQWIKEIQENLYNYDISQETGESEHCLSPSDFGFHNMLVDSRGVLRFFDFEYAGWDEPAKMVCDFFCQPRIPVPVDWMEPFVEEAFGEESWTGDVMNRIQLLYPLYRVKWCCIMMNEFLPEGGRRRAFSANTDFFEECRLTKLEAAEQYLKNCPLPIGGNN